MHLYAVGYRQLLLCGIASLSIIATSEASASDARATYHIAPQPLDRALRDFGLQSDSTMMADAALIRDRKSQGFNGVADPETVLAALLRGTKLTYRRNGTVFVVRPISDTGMRDIDEANERPQAASDRSPVPKGDLAGNVPAATRVAADQLRNQETAPNQEIPLNQEIIVTAQKRAESIQKVPIAISAFSAKNLDEYKIESGSELLRAVPNVNFSKNNFSGYNFSIRGVGTKAVSVTTDPAVAISFNNTPLIRNRLFEQEYFDVERIEVLRGPQGTLYGRNATGGVVNMIPAKPTDKFEGELKGELGNYSSRRLQGMLNIPITNTFALRVAGAYTNRGGFDYNTVTDEHVNGRNLWSGRATLQWKPSPDFNASFVWEHFGEHDDRSRTGKQLCTPDPGPDSVGGIPVPESLRPGLSQGCKPGSLYGSAAYGVPNGLSLPFVQAAGNTVQIGFDGPFGNIVPILNLNQDPYGGVTQSRDLREIETRIDPIFRARNDVFQFNADAAIAPGLRLYSQTLYTADHYYSLQDYNRFNSQPVFNDSDNTVDFSGNPIGGAGLTPGGVFNDPQLGPSNTILAADVNKSRSTQWSQEFRIQSSYSGPINFSAGVNYLHFHVNEDYYVFDNLFTAIAEGLFNGGNSIPFGGSVVNCPPGDTSGCVYIDPNPINKINGQGHNYFRSHNLYSADSYAAFGEAYWRATNNFKVTAGLRWTDDRKTTTPVPSQLLLAPGLVGGGFVNSGYPETADIKQTWKKVTGRLAVDWTPHVSFTDSTLFYASFARGYKGGGANPPGIDANPAVFQFESQPSTFKPEYLNAFEIGTKNTLGGGRITLNASAFFYDYKNYQVSKIVDRTAVNENFDAHTWGAEIEATWRPVPRFRINANLGYLGTRIAKGAKSIDVMDRTQGDPDLVTVRPWVQLTSNCVAPRDKVEKILSNPISSSFGTLPLAALCGGAGQFGNFQPGSLFSELYGFTYNPLTDAPNGGQGLYADVGGNQLPNAPHWTFNIGAQYSFEMGSWELTPRVDYYVQSGSWARIYNTAYDRLRSWDNTNISLSLDQRNYQLTFEFYVKNLFNKTPLTDAFTNSDDSGLTTNVFTLDPRVFGLSVKKRF